MTAFEDLQAKFDIVVRGLAAQGWERSRRNPDAQRDTCLYRGPNGWKCAIGHLIPDELYRPEFENEGGATDLLDAVATRDERLFDALQKVLPPPAIASEWQSLHDDANDAADMLDGFLTYAEHTGLTWPVDVAKWIP